MAATLTSILLHVTFSTKHREPIIPLDLRDDLFRFIGGVCREMNSPLLHAGGTQDHIHLLLSLAKTTSVADLMLHVKRSSSAWIKNQRPGLHLFAWQDGYFAFSVGHESVDAVRAYLDRQDEHHRSTTFQEETLAFLTKYGVTFDLRYLWE
ncbi:MAG: IS200/IS605 family transposase [Planctomycetota bacterium]|nr:IS200/IS605 family transposase [Planctomycetota bacterium]